MKNSPLFFYENSNDDGTSNASVMNTSGSQNPLENHKIKCYYSTKINTHHINNTMNNNNNNNTPDPDIKSHRRCVVAATRYIVLDTIYKLLNDHNLYILVKEGLIEYIISMLNNPVRSE
eukprot:UN10634